MCFCIFTLVFTNMMSFIKVLHLSDGALMEIDVSHRAASPMMLLIAKMQTKTSDHGNSKGVVGSETPTYLQKPCH